MTLINMTHSEVVEFDHDVLADLCQRYGTGTEAVIADVLAQIEDLLVLATLQINADQRAGLTRTCGDLIALASAIGMRTLTRATSAVLECLTRNEDAALHACAHRMLRLGKPEAIDQWTVRHNTVA